MPSIRGLLRWQLAHVLPHVGAQDIRLDAIAAAPCHIGAAQFECWEHTRLIIDVVPGRGSGFSLERRRASAS